MLRVLTAAALTVAILQIDPARAQQSAVPPQNATEKIAALTKQQTDFLMKKDATALAALFTANAVYVTVSGDIYSGHAEIQGYYSQTISALGDFTRESVPDEVQILGAAAWARGHGLTVVKTADSVAELKDHWVAIYEMADGEWKIRVMSIGENVKLLPAKF
jgi:uncharacterized protein (TIGR02246 family)